MTKIASNTPSLDKNAQAVAPLVGDALRREAKEAAVTSIVRALEESTGRSILGTPDLHLRKDLAADLRILRNPIETLAS